MVAIRRIALVLATLALSGGCARSHPTPIDLPSFSDVSAAPAAIQTAAKAIVRIGTTDEFATGSFISPTGLLLTNNHVLGVDICPREGCYAQLSFMFQRGSSPQTPLTVFAVPQAVDVGLDMAVVQVYDGPSGGAITTPEYLTLDARDPGQLLGEHVHVVGHPEGGLKKWTQGEVVDAQGTWIFTSAFILPGNSGSPLLDDDGHIVGIVHRGPTAQDLVSDDGVDEYSIGTASSALIAAMAAPLPAAMRSVAASTTDDDVVQFAQVYRNAQVKDAVVDGAPKPVLTSLAAACDAGLARDDYESPEDLSSALAPCTQAVAWIDCRTDSGATFAVCPDDVDAWRQRFQSVFDRWQSLNGMLELDEVTFAQEGLASSIADGQSAATQGLNAALAAASPPLDFGIANYLAAFDVPAYHGKNVVDFVRGYASVPGYGIQATDIASAAVWFSNDATLQPSQTISLLKALASDPTVDLGGKLYVEQVLYRSGAL
ncbi:MAG TPA: serine protease [Polyangiaceae bacterium]|jgi:hypothetical protein|nr:serine protease [Polyangiaceae bacterium]